MTLVCACGQEAKEFTLDGSRGIVDKQKREVVIALDWTCLGGHRNFNWLPEDEAYKLARETVASNTGKERE